MKIGNKNGLKFVLLAVMMLTMVFYGCADDGGGLTGMDAEAAGYASSNGITLPASIESIDPVPTDDIDMRTSTGDVTTNDEWLTDQNNIDTSITLPAGVAKSMVKATFSDSTNYNVSAWFFNDDGFTNIEFYRSGSLFYGSLPITHTTSYFCYVIYDLNGKILYRSHFKKITKVDGITDLIADYNNIDFIIPASWTAPVDPRFGGSYQVWYGTNMVADFLASLSYSDTNIVIDVTGEGIDPNDGIIVRVVSLDTSGKPFAASSYAISW